MFFSGVCLVTYVKDKFTNPEHPLILRHPLALEVLELSMVCLSTTYPGLQMLQAASSGPVGNVSSPGSIFLHSSFPQMDLFKESPLVEEAAL